MHMWYKLTSLLFLKFKGVLKSVVYLKVCKKLVNGPLLSTTISYSHYHPLTRFIKVADIVNTK